MKKYDAYGNRFTLKRLFETRKKAKELNRQHMRVKTFSPDPMTLNQYCPVCYMEVGLPDGKCPCGARKKETEELEKFISLVQFAKEADSHIRKERRQLGKEIK